MLAFPAAMFNRLYDHGGGTLKPHTKVPLFSSVGLDQLNGNSPLISPGDRPTTATFGTTSVRIPVSVPHGGRSGHVDSAYVRCKSFHNGACIFATACHGCTVAAEIPCTGTYVASRIVFAFLSAEGIVLPPPTPLSGIGGAVTAGRVFHGPADPFVKVVGRG